MNLTCSGCHLPIQKGDDYILWERGVVNTSPKSGMDTPIPDVEDVLHPRCAAEWLSNPNCVLYDEVLDRMGQICQNCYEEIQEIGGTDEVPVAQTPTAPVFIPPWSQGR